MPEHPHTRRLRAPSSDLPADRRGTSPVSTFDPEQFANAIQKLGLRFWWSRAIDCPCRMAGPDQFKPNCANCGGDGWWYVNPNHREETHLTRDFAQVSCTFGVMGLNLKWDQFQPFGGFDSGEAIMTMQSEASVTFRDRFIGVEQRMGRSELLRRGSGDLVKVGHYGRSSDDIREAMRYEPLRINYVAETDGTVPGTTLYYEGIDYRLREPTASEPRRMMWLTGRGPAAGAVFTVHYDCHPVWVVNDASYGVQGLVGPDAGLKGEMKPQILPSTFKVMLDFLAPARGT